jgi:mediator of RNA polymerase II transcription subunit 14
VTISIVEAREPPKIGSNPLGGFIGGPVRPPKARILAEIQERSKLGATTKPSDDVEGLKIEVTWEPTKGALNVSLPPYEAKLSSDSIKIVCH